MIDALDQLLPHEGAYGLGWLLGHIPERVHLVVSAPEGDCLDALRRRQAREIGLPPLTESDQREIVHTFLKDWGRKLGESQIQSLLAHSGVENPLYLRVALEELRLFGSFEQLANRIQALAEDIPGLFDQLLARLERDYGRELVTEAFSLLKCSRYGLSEAELLELLRGEEEDHFPHVLWARLARGARAYLVERGELMGFLYRQLGEAITTRYLIQNDRHSKLSEYFKNAPTERKLAEYPYQLVHAERWLALATAVSEPALFLNAVNCSLDLEWIRYWQSLDGRFDPADCYEVAVGAREQEEGQTEQIGQLWHAVSAFLYEMGQYTPALAFEGRALEILESIRGPADSQIAISLNNQARILAELGRFEDAVHLYERALEIEKSVYDTGHPQTANSMNDLAMVYMQQKKAGKAIPLLEQALVICEGKYGADHPNVAALLENLASVHAKTVDYAKAESLCQRALAIEERVFGPDHPEVASCLNNFASVYTEWGKHKLAVPLFERALIIWERALDSLHPKAATTYYNLATIHHDNGQLRKALPLYERAVRIAETFLGPKHPDSRLYRADMKACAGFVGSPFMESLYRGAIFLRLPQIYGAFYLILALGLVTTSLVTGYVRFNMFIPMSFVVGAAFGMGSKLRGAVSGVIAAAIVTVSVDLIHHQLGPMDIPLHWALIVNGCVGALGGASGAALRTRTRKLLPKRMR